MVPTDLVYEMPSDLELKGFSFVTKSFGYSVSLLLSKYRCLFVLNLERPSYEMWHVCLMKQAHMPHLLLLKQIFWVWFNV